jgi:hypothetical protein
LLTVNFIESAKPKILLAVIPNMTESGGHILALAVKPDKLKLGPTGAKILIAALLMSKKIFPIDSIFILALYYYGNQKAINEAKERWMDC